MKVGPVEVMVCAFPRPQVDSAVIDVLGEAVKPGTLAVIDLVLLSRDNHGVVHVHDLEDRLQEAWLDLVDYRRVLTLLSSADLEIAAESMGHNETALVLALDHRWQQLFSNAVQDAGGVTTLYARIPHETVAAAIEAVARRAVPDTDSKRFCDQ
jgi:KaiC/GvpD/RAD55 family RecA-like ATPase